MRTAIARSIEELAGGGRHRGPVEGLFLHRQQLFAGAGAAHRGGNLARALLASAAIPGALPPVMRDGDLLCDGGTFNNFPVDAMRELRGIGKVIGVDLGVRSARRLDIDEVPGSWTLLLDRLRPRRQRRYRLPSLTAYLLNITILYSTSRQREVQRLTDLYFNPPLYKVGLLQWSRFDEIVRQGYEYAIGVLDADPATQRETPGVTPERVTGARSPSAGPVLQCPYHDPEPEMRSLDEEIARRLAEAAASGELSRAEAMASRWRRCRLERHAGGVAPAVQDPEGRRRRAARGRDVSREGRTGERPRELHR